MNEPDTFLITAGISFLLLAFIIFLCILNEFDNKRHNKRLKAKQDLDDQSRDRMRAYGWSEEEIEDFMKKHRW